MSSVLLGISWPRASQMDHAKHQGLGGRDRGSPSVLSVPEPRFPHLITQSQSFVPHTFTEHLVHARH